MGIFGSSGDDVSQSPSQISWKSLTGNDITKLIGLQQYSGAFSYKDLVHVMEIVDYAPKKNNKNLVTTCIMVLIMKHHALNDVYDIAYNKAASYIELHYQQKLYEDILISNFI